MWWQLVLLQASDVINQATMFFRDGKRRIDFVLAYHEENTSFDDAQLERMRTRRRKYEENLIEEGLELEHEKKEVCSRFHSLLFL